MSAASRSTASKLGTEPSKTARWIILGVVGLIFAIPIIAMAMVATLMLVATTAPFGPRSSRYRHAPLRSTVI